MTKNYIKQNKHNDLILSVAWAMIEQGNAVDAQGRMLAKLYLTLRDHEELRRGFAGKHAHIRGGDVMQHLLSHVGEFSSTKHKFTKDADTVFDELEDWSEALQVAKAKAEELSKERRFASTRAPMLFSPAGMLALVVIAYPDSKYTERIGRLQLSWMLDQPREELDAQDGFWKGLNKTNLEHITVVGLETELFEQQSTDSDGGTPAPTPAPELLNHDTCSAFQKHLQSPCTKTQAELHGWLANKLSGESRIIGGWVKYWVYRIDKAAHYEEQLIVQSLFQQSLNVLYRLYDATDVSETTADIYILSDMDEEEEISPNLMLSA
ncbi:hypothetical protein KJ359_001722 [Pestalotiopsis sp. 9143b]|nr:hypothetical protein KJ359_001722 [Pestalotiopsis sp. 9143b]